MPIRSPPKPVVQQQARLPAIIRVIQPTNHNAPPPSTAPPLPTLPPRGPPPTQATQIQIVSPSAVISTMGSPPQIRRIYISPPKEYP